MKKPSFSESSQQQIKKNHWPVWFPYPSSWLKAFILVLFLRVIIFIIEITGRIGYRLAYLAQSPDLLIMFLIVIILLPILIIAFTHHYLHLLINRFASEIQAPEIANIQGILPNLISWWEGIYGWVVIVISTLITVFFGILFLPVFNISYTQNIEYYTNLQENVRLIFGFFWLIQGALIYQFEYAFRQNLISIYSKKL